MTRYRKRPVEVEAWQAGSDEPMPVWAVEYMSGVPHFTENKGYAGLWLCLHENGYIELCTRHQFKQTYEVVE